MKYIGQMMVVTSAILFGACFDGYAFGMYGFGGLLIRLMVCSCTLAAGLAVEKKAGKRKRACVRSRASTTAVCRRSEVKRSDCAQMRATHEREQAVVDTKKKASGNRNFPKAHKNNKYEVICHR